MTRWKEPPGTLAPRGRELVAVLREHKDSHRLSLAVLAARTGYSKSSWDRYLNGRSLPPEPALQAFARLCGIAPERLVAMRAAALQERSVAVDERPAARPTGPVTEVGDVLLAPAPATEPARWRTALVSGVLSSLLTAAVLLGGQHYLALSGTPGSGGAQGTATSADRAPSGPGTYTFVAGRTYACTVERDAAGRNGAGYSTTRTERLAKGAGGWPVVEAQCLVKHHGIDTGDVDGAYGNHTRHAIQSFQRQAHLPETGVVDPRTWQALRT
ncbi:peptidoglycan-binding protein [Streptomyces sp. NBC_00203]|uniref:peptidoglycan-binding protein n=1 Tax=Streptomyces sp. NBC_00203 TaxID=2975680 RepID=UPI003244CC5F